MNIIGMSIKRPVTACMITIGVAAFGLISLMKLPINLLPDLSYPTLTLETRYPGAAPEEVEYLITRPIEEAVAVIPNVKRISSSSKPELSQVTLEFNWGRKMDFAILDVSKKVDLLRFPEGIEKPRILRYDPNQDPILKISATSPEMTLAELRYFCEEDLKKRLEGIGGLASVEVAGGREEIIQVELDEAELKRFGISIEEVKRRLTEENVNRAGGSLYENEARFLVRTLNEFGSLDDIGNTIVSRKDDRRIYLREIAKITVGHKDLDHIARIDGSEGVSLAFYKEGDANTVTVSRSLRKAIDKEQEKLGEKVALTTTFVGATFIEQAVNEVMSNAIIGGIIAIFVLLFFLRDVRGTIIVGFSIPVSVMACFFLMMQFDVSMNIMSLGGLALGIGMLVDNSIVVLESIFVRRSMGDDPAQAAEKGASIVSGAVVASTLTTVVVFLPIVFIEGIGGQLFRDLGMTVTFALVASLVVSLTLMPTLFNLFHKFSKKKPAKTDVNPEDEVEIGMFSGNLYSKFLTAALRFRYLVIIAVILLMVQIGGIYKSMRFNLVPEMSQGDYYILAEMEEGTPINTTDRVAGWIEQQIMQEEGVKVVFSSVGEFNQGVETRTGENLAQVNFSLKADEQVPEAVLNRIRERLDGGPTFKYQVGTPSYFTFKTPIEVELYNENQKELERANQAMLKAMGEIPQIKDVRTTVAEGNPEVRIVFNRDTMSKLGLSIAEVSNMIRDKIQGATPTRFVRSGRDLDIMVRLREADRENLSGIDTLAVGYRENRPIYLSSVAEVIHDVGPAQIKRISQKRAAVISAGVTGGDLKRVAANLAPLKAQVEAAVPGTVIDIGGQNKEMDESFKSMMQMIALAVFLVYLVMASQFESLGHPFLILFTIPIGIGGGLVALYLADMEISVIALIGLVMLAGIVVNNAIVLIDYINQIRRKGSGVYEAIIIAGNRRMRPIFMTTATTVLGLIPMALGLGSGAEMRAPLAIAVIGGLVFSTVLTLVIIPVVYGAVTPGLKIPGRAAGKTEREVAA
ncbi:efflux RND transporter permease subunit [Acanthopleuribacter pedis]|uniref:Efflux RND transporter permease subunit n=1 Tax=Acanthopleuribacter pedis TaxID=442870 RepID=A0A8J7U6Q3_9BACT|nr:efflux RND transporter permease subunit [Acanthopleuribacter pedis]MBO1321673.1 efflux RND transporter permease subunit [Acanthopleuribacter pedis]